MAASMGSPKTRPGRSRITQGHRTPLLSGILGSEASVASPRFATFPTFVGSLWGMRGHEAAHRKGFRPNRSLCTRKRGTGPSRGSSCRRPGPRTSWLRRSRGRRRSSLGPRSRPRPVSRGVPDPQPAVGDVAVAEQRVQDTRLWRPRSCARDLAGHLDHRLSTAHARDLWSARRPPFTARRSVVHGVHGWTSSSTGVQRCSSPPEGGRGRLAHKPWPRMPETVLGFLRKPPLTCCFTL